jgi:hypothetical protein
MRFGRTSTLSLLSTAGLVWALGWGCASKNDGSTFSSGSGPGTNAGSGTNTTNAGSGTLTNGSGPGTQSTTTIVNPTTGGSTGAGGSGGLDPDASCGATKQGTSQIPTDIFVMEDKSGSMQCPANMDACQTPPMPLMPPTRWDAFTMAVNTFINAPDSAGIGVGLGFFPIQMGMQTICDIPTYSTPAVPIAPLPGNAMAISNAIAMNMPAGGTPTRVALSGAIAYARTYTMNTPGRTAAVLLVTDGVPNDCQSNVNNVSMVAQQGFTGMPPIKTYVVGLGNTAGLDQIALAGTGGLTHYFPATGDVSGQLVAALKAITGMITCSYTIPPGSDPKLVNVEVTVGMSGMPTKIGIVSGAAACDARGGWYYDNPMMPTQIILCPQSCGPLQMTPNSGVSILYGCPSVPPA